MKFDINALIQKQKRPIKDKKQLSAELKKTIEQEEDPRIQKHKINALKKGYTPEEAEKIAIAIPENNAKNPALQNVNYCVTDFRRTPVRLQIRSL